VYVHVLCYVMLCVPAGQVFVHAGDELKEEVAMLERPHTGEVVVSQILMILATIRLMIGQNVLPNF